jgi:hypothetical protein
MSMVPQMRSSVAPRGNSTCKQGAEGRRGGGAEGQRGRGAEGQRGRGAEGQRGRGAEGQRGRGAEGQRGGGVHVMRWLCGARHVPSTACNCFTAARQVVHNDD